MCWSGGAIDGSEGIAGESLKQRESLGRTRGRQWWAREFAAGLASSSDSAGRAARLATQSEARVGPSHFAAVVRPWPSNKRPRVRLTRVVSKHPPTS